MAKKKLTAKQKAARKRASYYKAEYKKNLEAIYYLMRFTELPYIKVPQKITKTSVKTIRKIYQQTKSKIDTYETGFGQKVYVDMSGMEYVSLPSKEEASKIYREEKQGKKIEQFDPIADYIDEIKLKMLSLTPLRDSNKTEDNYQKNVVPKLEKVKDNFLQAIDDAIAKYGEQRVAETLAKNDYMQRIGDMELKYTYQIVDEMTDGDSGMMKLLDASVDSALLKIK